MSEQDSLGVLSGLRTHQLGQAHEHHAVLGSTNDRAWAWHGEGAPHGALVTADAQTAGRGRLGREWSSPAGGRDIYASVLLRGVVGAGQPPAAMQRLAGVALVVAVALREAIVACSDIAGERVGLKWPNDVWIDQRKVAGILCEGRVSDRGADVVVGIGCNVHRRAFAGELAGTATSLALAADKRVPSRARLLVALLERFEALLAAYFEHGFAAIRDRYEPHSLVVGRWVDLRGSGGASRRVFVHGLDAAGGLRVAERRGGAIETVTAGEVSLRLSE